MCQEVSSRGEGGGGGEKALSWSLRSGAWETLLATSNGPDPHAHSFAHTRTKHMLSCKIRNSKKCTVIGKSEGSCDEGRWQGCWKCAHYQSNIFALQSSLTSPAVAGKWPKRVAGRSYAHKSAKKETRGFPNCIPGQTRSRPTIPLISTCLPLADSTDRTVVHFCVRNREETASTVKRVTQMSASRFVSTRRKRGLVGPTKRPMKSERTRNLIGVGRILYELARSLCLVNWSELATVQDNQKYC